MQVADVDLHFIRDLGSCGFQLRLQLPNLEPGDLVGGLFDPLRDTQGGHSDYEGKCEQASCEEPTAEDLGQARLYRTSILCHLTYSRDRFQGILIATPKVLYQAYSSREVGSFNRTS